MADRANPVYTRHVKALWEADDERLHELFEAAESVRLLAAHPGYQAIRAVLEREVATIDAELDHGQARSAEDYAKAHGRRSALRAIDEIATIIVERAAIVRVKAEEKAQRADAARASEEVAV